MLTVAWQQVAPLAYVSRSLGSGEQPLMAEGRLGAAGGACSETKRPPRAEGVWMAGWEGSFPKAARSPGAREPAVGPQPPG